MKLNAPNKFTEQTHEGAPAAYMTPEQALRRSVMSCLLWEREFYEDGEAIADRISHLADCVETQVLADLAVEARTHFKLRHVPLLLLERLTHRQGAIVGETIAKVIQRADELAEFLAIYWRNGKHPLSKQTKVGLAKAFKKFNAYQLAKYNRDNAIKLRDVMFMTHPKPMDDGQATTWAKLAAQQLESPDTWEVALSGGADKRETFERLISEGNLGYLALLRNLRNMRDAGVNDGLIGAAILLRKNGAERVLPFRYVAAARAVPQFEPYLDQALKAAIGEMPVLSGLTIVLVDVSGSMETSLSHKSDLNRLDAAAALASIIPAEQLRVFTFSNSLVEVAPRRGMAGVDVIKNSQSHGGTQLGQALTLVNQLPFDRLIVITDEQSHDRVQPPTHGKAYMINVASYKNGVGYGGWTHIDGFSEAIFSFIREVE